MAMAMQLDASCLFRETFCLDIAGSDFLTDKLIQELGVKLELFGCIYQFFTHQSWILIPETENGRRFYAHQRGISIDKIPKYPNIGFSMFFCFFEQALGKRRSTAFLMGHQFDLIAQMLQKLNGRDTNRGVVVVGKLIHKKVKRLNGSLRSREGSIVFIIPLPQAHLAQLGKISLRGNAQHLFHHS